jgi:hypothetical protein
VGRWAVGQLAVGSRPWASGPWEAGRGKRAVGSGPCRYGPVGSLWAARDSNPARRIRSPISWSFDVLQWLVMIGKSSWSHGGIVRNMLPKSLNTL